MMNYPSGSQRLTVIPVRPGTEDRTFYQILVPAKIASFTIILDTTSIKILEKNCSVMGKNSRAQAIKSSYCIFFVKLYFQLITFHYSN